MKIVSSCGSMLIIKIVVDDFSVNDKSFKKLMVSPPQQYTLGCKLRIYVDLVQSTHLYLLEIFLTKLIKKHFKNASKTPNLHSSKVCLVCLVTFCIRVST